MKYLKDSRMMTTHKTIVELINEGKIKTVKRRDKPDSKIDYLIINEDNEFNKIYNSLLAIEKEIGKIFNIRWKKTPESIVSKLTTVYIDFAKLSLDFLLGEINTKIRSEKDASILYKKAINLMQKIHTNPYYLYNSAEEADRNLRRAEEINLWIEQSTKGDDMKIDDIIDSTKRLKDLFLELAQKQQEKYKKHFLKQDEQKMEKS
jgi:hypothetical protein